MLHGMTDGLWTAVILLDKKGIYKLELDWTLQMENKLLIQYLIKHIQMANIL